MNVFDKYGKVLVSFMPFSRRDDSTSFRIFISNEVCQNESADVEAESEPDAELHDTPEL